jgi:RNA polymerase sigma-70 factor (ECF subfamily)
VAAAPDVFRSTSGSNTDHHGEAIHTSGVDLADRGIDPKDVSEAALVDRVRNGDAEAFEAIYERYFKRIYHFVHRRLNIRADAEEATQEVFISVFSSIDSYRGDAPLAAWIFGITRRVVAARFRRKRHTMLPLGDDDSEQWSTVLSKMSSEPTPLESYECQERLQQMRDVLERRLTREQQLLFQLHHLEELPISEIAAALNKSENAVKSNLYRARKLLLDR